MGLLSGSKKIFNAVNPIRAAKPGAEMIRDSFKELTEKKTENMMPLDDMAEDHRRYLAGRLRRYGMGTAMGAAVLGGLSIWSGIIHSSIAIMLSSALITIGLSAATLVRFWHAHMIEYSQPMPLSHYIATLFGSSKG